MTGGINVRVSEEEVRRWKHAAIDEGLTLSEMVRQAMKLYLDKLEDERRGSKKPKD